LAQINAAAVYKIKPHLGAQTKFCEVGC